MKTDKQKQLEMKNYYNNSLYFESAKENDPTSVSKFNHYLIKNVFKIYTPNKKEKIVDMGCGWGNISFSLLKKDFNVTGIDYSIKAIEFCKNTAKKLGLRNCNFICRDATKTQLKSNSVDVVYCADLVEHLYPEIYLKMLKEINRILKSKGKLIIYTPNLSYFLEIMKNKNLVLKKDISHVDLKSMNYLRDTIEDNNFGIKKAYYIESHIILLNFIEKMLMKYFPFLRRRIAILATKN